MQPSVGRVKCKRTAAWLPTSAVVGTCRHQLFIQYIHAFNIWVYILRTILLKTVLQAL